MDGDRTQQLGDRSPWRLRQGWKQRRRIMHVDTDRHGSQSSSVVGWWSALTWLTVRLISLRGSTPTARPSHPGPARAPRWKWRDYRDTDAVPPHSPGIHRLSVSHTMHLPPPQPPVVDSSLVHIARTELEFWTRANRRKRSHRANHRSSRTPVWTVPFEFTCSQLCDLVHCVRSQSVGHDAGLCPWPNLRLV